MLTNIRCRQTDSSGAVYDLSGHYRYLLWRTFEEGLGTVSFVMLNPNSASELKNDPTITRCARFAQDWGFKRLEVVNLFAYKAKTPKELMKAKLPIGEKNSQFILDSILDADKTILAWGNYGAHLNRSKEIVKLLQSQNLKAYCLGVNITGEPKHPLYIAKRTKPVSYLTRV